MFNFDRESAHSRVNISNKVCQASGKHFHKIWKKKKKKTCTKDLQRIQAKNTQIFCFLFLSLFVGNKVTMVCTHFWCTDIFHSFSFPTKQTVYYTVCTYNLYLLDVIIVICCKTAAPFWHINGNPGNPVINYHVHCSSSMKTGVGSGWKCRYGLISATKKAAVRKHYSTSRFRY